MRCCQVMARVRFFLPLLVFLAGVLPARDAHPAAALERGTAILDPAALRELDRGSFGLGRVMAPVSLLDAPLTNDRLFALPSMAPVRKALDIQFGKYVVGQQTALRNETIGVGASYDLQLFDRALLYSADTRFVLAGIVNRMDRAYLGERNCGEIRLIYRLTRMGGPAANEGAVSPRLPMTLNVVFKAKSDVATDSNEHTLTCAEIARRWIATSDWSLTGAPLAEKLLSADDGPLALVRPEHILRVEINLQIAHAPKSSVRDFRTDYLMMVFDYDRLSTTFEQARLENQIDSERILADETLRREFRTWLLEPSHLAELDRGTIRIPDKFLATAAIAPTPVGFSNPNLQPTFGLVEHDNASADPIFRQTDVLAALNKAEQHGAKFQNIRSVGGFERRLGDITCSGCHQTRGIGGFHLPGVDWMAAKPDNSTVVPGSPHFFADQIRRRDILAAFRDAKRPDYSRGFSGRPQLRGSSELAGTEYDDGWGAHCYIQHTKAIENDRSFKSWTCAKGLACQSLGSASRIGMCFVSARD